MAAVFYNRRVFVVHVFGTTENTSDPKPRCHIALRCVSEQHAQVTNSPAVVRSAASIGSVLDKNDRHHLVRVLRILFSIKH